MGLMTMLEQRASLEDPHVPIKDGFTLMDIFGGPSAASGKQVNERTAKQNTAVWAALQMITGSVASLPLKLYRRMDNGGKEEVRDHPAWGVVHDAPNERMSAVNFREAGQGHLLTRGNAYAEIDFNGRGQADALHLLDPRKVKLDSDDSGAFYRVRIEGELFRLPMGKVLHVKGLGFNGKEGWSPITLAREAIGHGLAIQEFSARFFANSSVPPGVLSTPQSLSPEAKEKLKKQWQGAQGGLPNAFKTAVLEEDLSYQAIGFTPEDSQLIQSEQLNWRKVAQVFNIPPHKLRDLSDATFSNIEAQNIEYVQDTLTPWLVRWEQELNRKLLSDRERRRGLFFEFVVDGLLRADADRRSNMIQTRINTGTWTINDVRRMENENPIDSPLADEPLVQAQMIPLSQAGQLSVGERTRLLQAAHGVEVRSEPETRAHQQGRLRLRNAFREVFLSATSDMVGREANDVDRFAERLLGGDDPAGFIEALETYYFGREDDEADFEVMARDLMGPVFRSYAESVGGVAGEEVELDEEPDTRAFADEYLDAFVKRYAGSSRRQLQKVAETDAESPQEAIEGRTEEWREGTDRGRPRAERVADREVVRLGEAATKSVWAAAGVLILRWQTVGDSCPFCRRMNGRTVGIRESFVDAGETFDADGADSPLQPSSSIGHPPLHRGCDCVVAPG